MKTKYLISSLIVFVCFFYGCDQFENINTNPDETTKVTSGMLATGLIKQISLIQKNSQKDFINDDLLAHYLSWTESACANIQFNKLGRTDFSTMTQLRNIDKMIEYATSDELRNSYEGLAHFARAYIFFYNTMKVGDIPYSEAIQASDGVFFPKYDSQKDVILGLLDELDKADALFSKGANFSGDYLYNGDCSKWRKAVNVMQLKILINLFNKSGDSDLKVKERFNTIISSRPIFDSIDDNLQIVYSSKAGQIYPINLQVFSYTTYEVLTSVLIDMLKDLGDYRLFSYASPTPNSVKEGKSDSDWESYNGVDHTLTESDIIKSQLEGGVSGINERYENDKVNEPVFLLSYQEMNFILAEAAARGLISQDPEKYYKEGIRSSMTFTAKYTADQYSHGRIMNDDYIENYIKSEKVKLSSDSEKMIEQIICQKFIAHFLQSPATTFFETRRTGYPKMGVNPLSNMNNPSDKLPLRWLYPSEELDYNSDNVNAAISNQFGGTKDCISKKWILQ